MPRILEQVMAAAMGEGGGKKALVEASGWKTGDWAVRSPVVGR
jgi:hypothetical protein